MNRIAIIIVSLILAMVVVLGGCTTVSPPAGAPAPMPAPTPALAAPELVTPHNGATGVELMPTLVWNVVPDAKGYELRVARNYDFSNIVHSVSTRLTGYEITEKLMPSTQYYWMVAAKKNPEDPSTPIAWSPVWKFTTAAAPAPAPPLEAPASSPPLEPTIDDIFMSRWGHTYYNNAPRVSYHSLDILKLQAQIGQQIPWQSYYKEGVFDCSEMTAYLEYMLERHGFTAEIAHGKVKGVGFHAWVLVYNDAADYWVPIEATSPTGGLDAPMTVLFQIVTGDSLIDYLHPSSTDTSIYQLKPISEYDWWDSPYANQLVEASDKAKLAAPLPPLPEIK